MDATKISPEPIDCNHNITATDVLIIGFGLSAIPLIRELERDGISYVIVSNGESIWDRLERHARLDFDLVSSMHTSLYSFELVNRDITDRYLTSKDYSAFIRNYQTQYGSKLVKDWVTSVDNQSSDSIVYTQGGRMFRTRHLVISTAFNRKMNHLLNEFDYRSAQGKTVAMTGMGDSVNLMISKLIPYGSRIILITNGFMLLDKLVFYDGASYTLDQLEYHNIRRLSNLAYRKTISFGQELAIMCRKVLGSRFIKNIFSKHPLAIPLRLVKAYNPLPTHSPVPNGRIAIKYWPIDSYKSLFDNDSLRQHIRDGYLLNDIAFFLEHGLVELWPKQDTVIDREKKTIRWKDHVVKYDYIADPDHESPNLPAIAVHRESSPVHKYAYVYRDNFMGVVPRQLRNVYFIGFTRPTTGGLNNITEMQCLFTHKMVTDPQFNHEIYDNIEERIRRYNNHYYPFEPSNVDHLVFYGFYTDDLARLMKINPRLADCRSLRDLALYFIFPNNTFKYRQAGPYKVEGVRRMVDLIYKDHKGFSIVINYLLNYALLQLTAYLAAIVGYYRGDIPAIALPFLLIIVLFNPVSGFVAANAIPRNSYVNLVLTTALGLTIYFKSALIPILALLGAGALTYALRRFGWTRAPFNDLKNKTSPEYQKFFQRYCEAFRKVFGGNDSQSTQIATCRHIPDLAERHVVGS
jgi:hypothetical protein